MLLSLNPREIMGLIKHGKDILSLAVLNPFKAFPGPHVSRFQYNLIVQLCSPLTFSINNITNQN